jgi:hypothetical protein
MTSKKIDKIKKVCIDKTIQAKDPEYEDWCLYEYWRSHKQIDKGKVIQEDDAFYMDIGGQDSYKEKP